MTIDFNSAGIDVINGGFHLFPLRKLLAVLFFINESNRPHDTRRTIFPFAADGQWSHCAVQEFGFFVPIDQLELTTAKGEKLPPVNGRALSSRWHWRLSEGAQVYGAKVTRVESE